MAPPTTVHDLRARCRGWPTGTVRLAVQTVIGDRARSPEEREALATLIAAWLTDADDSEPPPLNAWSVTSIWAALQQQRQ